MITLIVTYKKKRILKFFLKKSVKVGHLPSTQDFIFFLYNNDVRLKPNYAFTFKKNNFKVAT